MQLVKLIESQRITVWYSVPTVLTLMVLYGDMAAHDLSRQRAIVFAGEIFPTKYLRKLMKALPHVRYLNWYGPTETNVCTFYEVPQLELEGMTSVPIGKACANSEVFAVNAAGTIVTKPGELGTLYVRGPSLMQGYLGRPEMTAKVMVHNPFNQSFKELVYVTGDIVTIDAEGNYVYVGREDGMIKTRGYRVELGEIEAILYGHQAIEEAAVLAIPDELIGNRICAAVKLHEGSKLTCEDVMAFCRQRLPRYMIPEVVEFRETIPKTSTGKTERVGLAQSFAPE